MSAHDPVNHPSHYTSHPSGIECLQITRATGWPNVSNAIKYVWRNDLKDGVPPLQDLDKAVFYLEDQREHYGPTYRLRDEVVRDLLAVEEAEVKLYGSTHPRPAFFYYVARGLVEPAISEVRRLIDLCEEGSR